jgi:hypothetical protein
MGKESDDESDDERRSGSRRFLAPGSLFLSPVSLFLALCLLTEGRATVVENTL